MSILNERIKQRREDLGMSQAELAELLGYSNRSTIAKIEKGTNDITQSKIEAFAKALRTTPAYLMGWDDASLKATIEAQERLFQSIPPTREEAAIGALFAKREIYEHIAPDFTTIPDEHLGKVKKAYEFFMLAMRLSDDALNQLVEFARFLDEKGGLQNAINSPAPRDPDGALAPQEEQSTTPPPDAPQQPSEGK